MVYDAKSERREAQRVPMTRVKFSRLIVRERPVVKLFFYFIFCVCLQNETNMFQRHGLEEASFVSGTTSLLFLLFVNIFSGFINACCGMVSGLCFRIID